MMPMGGSATVHAQNNLAGNSTNNSSAQPASNAAKSSNVVCVNSNMWDCFLRLFCFSRSRITRWNLRWLGIQKQFLRLSSVRMGSGWPVHVSILLFIVYNDCHRKFITTYKNKSFYLTLVTLWWKMFSQLLVGIWHFTQVTSWTKICCQPEVHKQKTFWDSKSKHRLQFLWYQTINYLKL